jgi:hypothetical protein
VHGPIAATENPQSSVAVEVVPADDVPVDAARERLACGRDRVGNADPPRRAQALGPVRMISVA